MIPEVILAMIVCLVGSIAFAFCATGAVILLAAWFMPPELSPPPDCRPPVLVPPLPPLEPMADGLHVRVRVDLEVSMYWAEVWQGGEYVVDWPGCYYTEAQAQAMGEDWICRIRANAELKAAGQHEAAGMVW